MKSFEEKLAEIGLKERAIRRLVLRDRQTQQFEANTTAILRMGRGINTEELLNEKAK